MNSKDEIVYIHPFLRSGSAIIDMFIVAFLRIIFAQIVGIIWVNRKIIEFHHQFNEKFGVPFSNMNQDHVMFLVGHEVVKVIIIFFLLIVLVGALYYAFLNSSSWSATIGKRLFNIVLVKDEGKALSFFQAFWHYFLSLIPWIFVFYILIYQAREGVTIYQAFSGNIFNFIIGVLALAWFQISVFMKRKNTIQDIIMGCCMVRGRVGGKIPSWGLKKQ